MFPEWTPYLQEIKVQEFEQRLRHAERRAAPLDDVRTRRTRPRRTRPGRSGR